MAAKTFSWNITVDEVSYKIELTKNKVTVNGGEPVKLNKLKQQSKYPNMEYYIPVGSKEVVLNTDVSSVADKFLYLKIFFDRI